MPKLQTKKFVVCPKIINYKHKLYTNMSTVLLAGGSGLIGSRLNELLQTKGYSTILLSRKKRENPSFYQWNVNEGTIDEDAILKADYVINLAGAGIVDKRWTTARKKELIDSRVKSASLLKDSFQKIKKPKAYLSASAIGFYGNRGDEWLTEISAAGDDGFLAECTVAWEEAAKGISEFDIRTAIFRIGIVLSTQGGALKEMIFPMKLGVAGYFGNGEAYYPWIHIDDVCNMFIWALENEEAEGIYNTVAPNPITVKDLTKKIKKARGRFALTLPVPNFALQIGMGEMSEMLLNSARVSCEKIQNAGFEFEHPKLGKALKDILKRKI